jgi:mannose-6-phosphate isomerase-like protein (cupin superfamily)
MTTGGTTRRYALPYTNFVEAERIPIHDAVLGIADVTALARAPWERTGGLGAFIELVGTFQSERGLYVGEIPPRAKLNPQVHLYEEQLFILSGRGVTTFWQGENENLGHFEWQRGSIFAIPPSVTHVLANMGNEPVVYLGVTTAPRIMNAIYDVSAAFSDAYRFVDLASLGGGNYFQTPDESWVKGWYKQTMLETRFISNVYDFLPDPQEQKVAGGRLTGYLMGPRFPRGHISTWPTGRYHKAHYHGPGAIVLGLDGDGYVLAWDAELGIQPYRNGNGDQVEQLPWGSE